jgi:glucuronoarabinoxylan endo-1,4-beta-xylanase
MRYFRSPSCHRPVRCLTLLGLALLSSSAGAQNLASNPGFESANTSGWFAFGASTIAAQSSVVRSGTYAAVVSDRADTWNGIGQSLQSVLAAGQTCNISVWVRLVASGNETIQLTMKKTDAAGTAYGVVAAGEVTPDSWTQLTGEYTLTVSGTLTELTLYLEVPSSATAEFYGDDLLVEAVGAPPPGDSGTVTIQWNQVQQVIDGFGASSAWRGNWSTALANMFFGTNNGTGTARTGGNYAYTGIGLSLLRSRIAPGGTTVEQNIMQLAQARGARVWSSPWSPAPAAQFKSNGNVNGGSFIGTPENYQAYANQLAGYVVNMKNQYGINLYALSIQNEPDANVTTYESCNWTALQIHDFIPYLAAALAASNVAATKIMLPESQNWTDPQGLRLTALNDPATAAPVGIIANHNYVPNNAAGDQTTPAALNKYGKALWQTEVAKLSGADSSIADGVYWAGRVHLFLTAAQANAWHYWWLTAYGTSNEGLCDTNDVPAKRMYTLGNFSRFVRPGFHRLATTDHSSPLQISAYKNLTNGQFAIVAINPTETAVEQIFHLNGFTVGTPVTPWLTSAAASLAPQTTLAVAGTAFTNMVPAMSVVTFTGQAAPQNTPPTFAAIADRATPVGVTLYLTNVATDAESPPQTLNFALAAGPTNVTVNSSNGVLTWRPLVSQADSTNLIRVRASDDGAPSLSATNEFTLTVPPLAPATLGVSSEPAGQLTLHLTGPLGADYSLLTSTNLVTWEMLFTTNPAAMPWQFSVPNAAESQRYFRLQLGP